MSRIECPGAVRSRLGQRDARVPEEKVPDYEASSELAFDSEPSERSVDDPKRGKRDEAGGAEFSGRPNAQGISNKEGSEVETGIDNCVRVAASISGSALQWSITGDENTLDHYTVFTSTDGFHLHPVADVPAGAHVLDLSSLQINAGTYSVFVKAVGKPMLFDHVSAAVTYKR